MKAGRCDEAEGRGMVKSKSNSVKKQVDLVKR